jgi:hypothetical protein
VDPVEDLSKAAQPAQEAASAVDAAAVVNVRVSQTVLLEAAIGTARAAFAEIAALSTSPSVNTARLGAIAQKALEALPVT